MKLIKIILGLLLVFTGTWAFAAAFVWKQTILVDGCDDSIAYSLLHPFGLVYKVKAGCPQVATEEVFMHPSVYGAVDLFLFSLILLAIAQWYGYRKGKP